MQQLKVMTIVGTRPEIIRLSRVISRLEAEPAIAHTLVHTGQNYDYELNQIFFEDLDLRTPDRYLNAAGPNAAATIGQVITRVDSVLSEVAPDAVLILGDTNSCLAAITAKKRKIPVFHMEAGNRCFDERVPEEINRRVVDHIADMNLTYSSIAREYLLREGLPPDRIVKTGSPMSEVLTAYRPKIDRSAVMQKLHLEPANFYLVSAHREENVEDSRQFALFVDFLTSLGREFGRRIIVSTHPRTRKRFESFGAILPDCVELLSPFAFSDFVHLQERAVVVFSDSGTITEESSLLDFPALNIREAHERPEGMEEASVPLVGLNWERIRQGISIVSTARREATRSLPVVHDYDVPNVSEKVVRIILSYVGYIRKGVWRQNC